MRINHIALEHKWNNHDIFESANTLVLGSFNPYNSKGHNTDYYYGRQTNFLWKSIANIHGIHELYFHNSLDRKLKFMKNHRVCFMDVIDSIEITSNPNNDVLVHKYINQKIFTEFSDQVLFTGNTNFKNIIIQTKRNYNSDILELIGRGNITKIIHTMGNNRINENLVTSPIEKGLGHNGFQGFINQISNREGVEFVVTSMSPSGRAVRVGGDEYRKQLEAWLRTHLFDK